MVRDDPRFSFKSYAQNRYGDWPDITKNPLDTTKASKKGRLALLKTPEGLFRTVREDEADGGDCLETVFENGVLLRDMTFGEGRANAEF